ncbi:hypothetical protein HN587_01765 [Candidatus Woesearchaeota archaeon]|jgi:hypothetical protein|nr:hypothetical protein [Candidatus Woesearchaeota archaeon]
MITTDTILLTVTFAGSSVMFAWFFFVREKGWKELFKRHTQEPIKYSVPFSKPKVMESMLKELPCLSIAEKKVIIQQCFGRPVRIIEALDKDGQSWLETITFYDAPSDGEFNMLFDKTKKNYVG